MKQDFEKDDIEDDEQDRHIPEITMMIAMIHEIFNLIIKRNSIAPSSWKKIQRTTGRSVVFHNFTLSSPQQERERDKSRELQADLWSSTTLHSLLHNAPDSTPSSIGISVQKNIPSNGPLYDEQTHFS